MSYLKHTIIPGDIQEVIEEKIRQNASIFEPTDPYLNVAERSYSRGIAKLQNVGSEALLHRQVCDYLRLKYPDALFHTDYAAGAKLTMGQAVANKRLQSSRAWPDIFIAEPFIPIVNCPECGSSIEEDWYAGLFLELKKEGTKFYKKDGTFVSEHVAEQSGVLQKLRDRGYKAEFCVGFDNAKDVIDEYLSCV